MKEEMEAVAGPCFNCDIPCDEDSFCYGCGVNVCEDCGIRAGYDRGHSPDEHIACPECGDRWCDFYECEEAYTGRRLGGNCKDGV